MTPFDFINSINNKKYLDDVSSYVPFLVNKGLSFNADTILYANEMNLCSNISKKMQYDYLFYSIRPRKRYTKWIKNLKPNDELESIKEYFNYNNEKAKAALTILNHDQIKEIKKKLEKGEQ